MSKGLKIAGAILALILIVLLGIGMANSGAYTISRSKEMAATPEQVYKVVADYNKWTKWSPWAKLDPNQTITVTGQPFTVGHHFDWKGNKDVGSGSMTITELKPNELIKQDLVFNEPQPDKSITSFIIKPNGDKTTVVWDMSGQVGLVGGIFMGVMGGMDKMIGPDFEKGLAGIEQAAAQEVVTPPAPPVETTTTAPIK